MGFLSAAEIAELWGISERNSISPADWRGAQDDE